MADHRVVPPSHVDIQFPHNLRTMRQNKNTGDNNPLMGKAQSENLTADVIRKRIRDSHSVDLPKHNLKETNRDKLINSKIKVDKTERAQIVRTAGTNISLSQG